MRRKNQKSYKFSMFGYQQQEQTFNSIHKSFTCTANRKPNIALFVCHYKSPYSHRLPCINHTSTQHQFFLGEASRSNFTSIASITINYSSAWKETSWVSKHTLKTKYQKTNSFCFFISIQTRDPKI